jgi:hypothetical protein
MFNPNSPKKIYPNFFVIGAAKSGTTSLHNYLAQHPKVFMSPVKEPNFFAFNQGLPDFNGPDNISGSVILRDRLKREKYQFSVTSTRSYQQLFSHAGSATAIGESSVSYLYYPYCAQRIFEAVPEARIIVILRNPVDRAYSKFQQFRRDAAEPIKDFESAIDAEPHRIKDNWSPTWFYLDRGFYYRQLKPYYDVFGKDRIHVALYDDFVHNPQKTVNEMFKHLDLDPFLIDTSQRHNVSGDSRVPRAIWIHDIFFRPNYLTNFLQRHMPESIIRTIRPYARRILLRKIATSEKKKMTRELRSRLTDIFREDILHLEQLLERDLSSWLTYK